MAKIVWAWRRRKFALLRLVRCRLQVDRKSGGWWFVLDMMNGIPRGHKLWDPSVALLKKWVVPMSVGVEGVVCRLGVVWGGVWCEALCSKSSSRERKKRVGEVGQECWVQE